MGSWCAWLWRICFAVCGCRCVVLWLLRVVSCLVLVLVVFSCFAWPCRGMLRRWWWLCWALGVCWFGGVAFPVRGWLRLVVFVLGFRGRMRLWIRLRSPVSLVAIGISCCRVRGSGTFLRSVSSTAACSGPVGI
uniref:Putative secreted peptide n=1 Tax=Anopheles braziliensis TaxID=58242 RepID=A0A2M3ZXX3_9DIPT